MTGNRALRPADQGLVNAITDLQGRVAQLERTPSGPWSIPVANLRPAVKAGAPSDADFTGYPTPIPNGTWVYDQTNSKWWVRHAAGTWKGVTLA